MVAEARIRSMEEQIISCHGVIQKTKNHAPSTIQTSSNLSDFLSFPLITWRYGELVTNEQSRKVPKIVVQKVEVTGPLKYNAGFAGSGLKLRDLIFKGMEQTHGGSRWECSCYGRVAGSTELS